MKEILEGKFTFGARLADVLTIDALVTLRAKEKQAAKMINVGHVVAYHAVPTCKWFQQI